MPPESVAQEIRALQATIWSDADPEGRAFASLGDAFRRAGEFDDARAVLNEGLQRHPDFATAHLVAGLLHRDVGNEEEAERAFERVLELDPENVVALDEAARLATARRDRDRALECLRRLRDLEGSDASLEDRIRSLEEDSEPMVAAPPASPAQPLAEAEEAEEDREVYTRTMAELYASQGLYARAARVYERLLEEDPADEELRSRLEAVRAAPEGTVEPPPERPVDEPEAEELAPQWTGAGEEAEDAEVSTPFAWSALESPVEGEEDEEADEEGRPISEYFESLLSWVPGAVPIGSLAPDAEPAPGSASLSVSEDGFGPEEDGEGLATLEEADEDDDFQEWLRSLRP